MLHAMFMSQLVVRLEAITNLISKRQSDAMRLTGDSSGQAEQFKLEPALAKMAYVHY